MSKSIIIEILDYDNSVLGRLDISDSQDFPLSLSYTISDGKDLESRFGDFSKSFDLPSTKNNNKLLGHIYDPLIKDDKSISGIKDCRILVDGIPFFVGQIQIKGSKQTTKPTSYQATIYGGNFAWASLLRDKGLCDLPFSSSTNLTYDYSDFSTSWSATQATSDIVYPLVSYGDFYPSNSNPDASVNMFDAYSTNQDWRFWVYVYNIIKQIFSNIGYTISSDFIETANFKKLIAYLPYGTREDEQLQDTYSFRVEFNQTQSCGGTGNGWKFLTGGSCGSPTLLTQAQNATDKQIQFPQTITDSSGSWNGTTHKWTCQRSGKYKFNAKVNFWFQTVTPIAWAKLGAYLNMKHTPISTGTASTIATTLISDPISTIAPFGTHTFEPTISSNGYIYMAQGDTVELQTTFDPQSQAANYQWWLLEGGDTTNSITGNKIFNGQTFFEADYSVSQLEIGETFSLKDVLPCDITQIDFLKGISHLFNLYFTTDVQRKIVYIEPFNDFFSKQDAVDWTQKLDMSSPTEDNYDIGLTQEINFKYKEDGNDGYLEKINEDPELKKPRGLWYSYYEILGNDYKKGVTEFENPVFSPTQQEHDHDCTEFINPALIPVMWEEPSIVGGLGVDFTPSRPEKGFRFAPRIAYYHGYINNPNTSNLITRWTRRNGSQLVNTQTLTTYPRATFVDWEDTSFPSLSYDDETVTPPNTTTPTTVDGLYTTYWKNMIDQLKESPKIRKTSINLKVKDIINLDMRKLVYLDGSWWRINKVLDFSPAKNETTKVELIQWIDL